MKLLDLVAMYEWPTDRPFASHCVQNRSGIIKFCTSRKLTFVKRTYWKRRPDSIGVWHHETINPYEHADDYKTAIVTYSQWEEARAKFLADQQLVEAAPEPATVAVDAGALDQLRAACDELGCHPASVTSVDRKRAEIMVFEAARRLLAGVNNG